MFGSWAAHTISNLDLHMRIALGNVLYASNDFRHSRVVGEGLAKGLECCFNGTIAVGSRVISGTGYWMYEIANGGASRVMSSGQRRGPVRASVSSSKEQSKLQKICKVGLQLETIE